MGLSQAGSTLVSQSQGAGREEGSRQAFKVSIHAMLASIVPAMALTFFFGNSVTRFFVDDPEVIAQGAALFRIVSISVIPFTLFTVINGAFEGGALPDR